MVPASALIATASCSSFTNALASKYTIANGQPRCSTTVSLTGRVALGKDPVISTAHSYDGQVWTQERAINVGSVGNRLQRIVWFRNGSMSHMRMQRFRGTSVAHVSFLRLEAQIEGLAV